MGVVYFVEVALCAVGLLYRVFSSEGGKQKGVDTDQLLRELSREVLAIRSPRPKKRVLKRGTVLRG